MLFLCAPSDLSALLAMAPKAKADITKTGCTPKTISESEIVPVMDISIANDSGWRGLNAEKVKEKV